MRTTRQTNVRRAVLSALAAMPVGILATDELLRNDARRECVPAPTTAELDVEIRAADTTRLIAGIEGETGTKWKITDAGRLWLAENP